jgi:hypothetical protein
MSGITEQDVQDFWRKTEAFLADLPQSDREVAKQKWIEELRAYGQARGAIDFVRVKRSLGGPRGLANTILLQHKLPLNPARTLEQSVFLILGIGFLSFTLFVSVLWWKFTPIFTVKDDRVQILGGLIDIDQQLGQVKIGDDYEYSESQFRNVFEGSYEIPQDLVEDVQIEFDRGQMEITYSNDEKIVWTCKVTAEPSEGFIRQEKELVVVNLKSVGGTDCSIKVPSRLKYTITGDAGKIDVIAPTNDTFVQLGNGIVQISPDSEFSYRFDLKVGQGIVAPEFTQISQEEGIEIKVELGNGKIQNK